MNESCGFCFSSDLVEFTDEEGYGRYLDLHDCYLKYINLKGVEVTIPILSVSCILLFEILCCNSYSPCTETGVHHIPVLIRPAV